MVRNTLNAARRKPNKEEVKRKARKKERERKEGREGGKRRKKGKKKERKEIIDWLQFKAHLAACDCLSLAFFFFFLTLEAITGFDLLT